MIDTLPVKTGEILGSLQSNVHFTLRRACRSKTDSLSTSVLCLRVPHGDDI
jgi:hypothetical protein